MGEKKLHYKMYKDGKKFVFAAIATLSFFVFGGVSTVAVHADTTSDISDSKHVRENERNEYCGSCSDSRSGGRHPQKTNY